VVVVVVVVVVELVAGEDSVSLMARSVTSEQARIGRRCALALEALQTSGYPCRGDLPYRAHAACAHVPYGTRLDRHARTVMTKFAKACPTSGFDGVLRDPRRKRRRR
jgi:hypothetical protein